MRRSIADAVFMLLISMLLYIFFTVGTGGQVFDWSWSTKVSFLVIWVALCVPFISWLQPGEKG